mgnify:CR=1 FL=1
MTHLWVRAESRAHEERVGLTPDGAAQLMAAGIRVTVEHSVQRAIPIDGYATTRCEIAPEGSWVDAPADAILSSSSGSTSVFFTQEKVSSTKIKGSVWERFIMRF